MARPVIRLGLVGMLCGLSWVVASRPPDAGIVRGGVASATCAPGVSAPAVCDRALGVALTLPKDWSVAPPGKFPPGTLDFWTVVPGRDEATLHLSIDPLASTTACSDAQAVLAVANAAVFPGVMVSSPRHRSFVLHPLKTTRHTPQRLHQCPPPPCASPACASSRAAVASRRDRMPPWPGRCAAAKRFRSRIKSAVRPATPRARPTRSRSRRSW